MVKMLLKELVLDSMEDFATFVIDGKELSQQAYLDKAHIEVDSYYLDVVDGQAKMFITLVEFN